MEVIIRNETTSDKISNEYVVDFLSERITVRELIRSWVYQEVQSHNLHHVVSPDGTVIPTSLEQIINSKKPKPDKDVDWKEQYERAIAGFEKKQYIILVDDYQPALLDETVELKHRTEVTFLRLTLLTGG